MEDVGLWDQLSHDVDAKLNAQRGYVGYGDNIAIEIFEDNIHAPGSFDDGFVPIVPDPPAAADNSGMPALPSHAPGAFVALKTKPTVKRSGNYTGYLQGGIVALLSVVGYSAFMILNKKEEKKVVTSAEEPLVDLDEEEQFAFQMV